MLEWVAIILIIIGIPATIFWACILHFFIPCGTVEAKCIKVDVRQDTVTWEPNGHARRTKTVFPHYPVVEYVWENQRFVGTALINDLGEKIAPGDTVKIAVNRGNKEQVLLLSGPIF